MVRHDYDLPPDWEAKTPEEKDEWFKQERVKRQAISQETTYAEKVEKEVEREKRKLEAKNSYTFGG